MNNNIIRPEPSKSNDTLISVNKKTDRVEAATHLIAGNYLLVEDSYSTGMAVLAELKKQVFDGRKKDFFLAYRNKRSEFYHASNRLLVPIKSNRIALIKSPDIGWLEKLYPDIEDFQLTFPQMQGLNSSWQWYLKGIAYPGLKEKIHPFYGTYFPTRYDHLNLFDEWLKKYGGSKTLAIDIGTGCGVLAFQMLNRGFEKVTASDIIPNSVISVEEHAKKIGVSDRLEVCLSDLFGQHHQKADLIVFNPPWLPAQKEIEGLDSAIYYEKDLFERFFSEAAIFLNEGGKLVVLFSNLAESAGAADFHPVKDELNIQKRYRQISLRKRKVKRSSKKTKRRDHRKKEYVELWELEPL